MKKCIEIEASDAQDIARKGDDDEDVDTFEQLNRTLSKLFSGFVVYLFVLLVYKNETIVSLTGGLSALCETCSPLPQLISNFRNKSVESLR